jgi:hypothetical protein
MWFHRYDEGSCRWMCRWASWSWALIGSGSGASGRALAMSWFSVGIMPSSDIAGVSSPGDGLGEHGIEPLMERWPMPERGYGRPTSTPCPWRLTSADEAIGKGTAATQGSMPAFGSRHLAQHPDRRTPQTLPHQL